MILNFNSLSIKFTMLYALAISAKIKEVKMMKKPLKKTIKPKRFVSMTVLMCSSPFNQYTGQNCNSSKIP